MRTYRKAGEPASVIVGATSQLAAALAVSPAAARAVYDDTTKRFEALYGKEDAEWFMTWGRHHLTGFADDLAKCQTSGVDCAKECMLGCKLEKEASNG